MAVIGGKPKSAESKGNEVAALQNAVSTLESRLTSLESMHHIILVALVITGITITWTTISMMRDNTQYKAQSYFELIKENKEINSRLIAIENICLPKIQESK